jgi:hypothetical protein
MYLADMVQVMVDPFMQQVIDPQMPYLRVEPTTVQLSFLERRHGTARNHSRTTCGAGHGGRPAAVRRAGQATSGGLQKLQKRQTPTPLPYHRRSAWAMGPNPAVSLTRRTSSAWQPCSLWRPTAALPSARRLERPWALLPRRSQDGIVKFIHPEGIVRHTGGSGAHLLSLTLPVLYR